MLIPLVVLYLINIEYVANYPYGMFNLDKHKIIINRFAKC